ncbi:MAG: hypothetical protein AABX75_01085 [Nanoarchaeota archaeon]|mgnify:FL=1
MIYDTARITRKTAIVYAVECGNATKYRIIQIVPDKSLSSIIRSSMSNMQSFTQCVQLLREQGFIIDADLSDEVLKEEAKQSFSTHISVLSRGRIEVRNFTNNSTYRLLDQKERIGIKPRAL